MTFPQVSIIIPVYNAEKYISDTIISARNQTWPEIEIIIIDDGSTDESFKIANTFRSQNIHICQQKKTGATAARNLGLRKAKGEYIQFLDADDLLSPDKIALQMQYLNNRKDTMAFGNTVFFFDGDNIHSSALLHTDYRPDYQPLKPYKSIDLLLTLYGGFEGRGSMICIHAWLTPKSIIDKAGWWNESLTVDDDGEFFCRAVLASEGAIYTPDALSYYRRFNEGDSLSGNKSFQAFQSRIRSIDSKYECLKKHSSHPQLNLIFAGQYWETGVLAYPKYPSLSKYCLKKSNQLAHCQFPYPGGDRSKKINQLLGWRAARWISYLRSINN